jgi:hypothetical protein
MGNDGVVELIRVHLERYPASGVMDVYKLLHQATFGPGHLIASKKAAQEWLEQEVDQLTPAPHEPLVENIHPEGELVRLHLRPYVAHRGQIKPLLDAFVRSADQVQGAPETILARWQVFETLCRAGEVWAQRFAWREVALFGRIRAQEHWPAVSHSPEYNSAYDPAYRVLTRPEAQALCEKYGVPFEVL